jgi:hypothetical protein
MFEGSKSSSFSFLDAEFVGTQGHLASSNGQY